MNKRTRAKKIGLEFEDRLIKFLESQDRITGVRKNQSRYPDLFFTIQEDDDDPTIEFYYAVEAKTIKYVYSNERRGYAKMSRVEFDGIDQLEGYNLCLIVELRPRLIKDGAFFFIPWEKVQQFWSTRPDVTMISLTFWWVIRNGVNLNWWLENHE